MAIQWGKRFQTGQQKKYQNQTSLCELGHSHRSKLESSVCQLLQLRMKAGEIQSFKVEQHVKVCGPPGHECSHKMKIEMIMDFECIMNDGSTRFVEAKGMPSEKYALKRRLFMHYNTCFLEVWGSPWQAPKLIEVLGHD